MQDIQDLQEFLTTAIEIIFTLFFTLIALNFIIGLAKLWNLSKLSSYQNQASEFQPSPTHEPEFQLADFPQSAIPTTEELPEPIPVSTLTNSALPNLETLAFLIEKSQQATIRTAARRLGIAIRVNGHYQRLAILRTQLKAKLKTNPDEVAQVLAELTAVAA